MRNAFRLIACITVLILVVSTGISSFSPIAMNAGTLPFIYNATDDFSTENGNPNGVWSYGWMPNDYSVFNLYTTHTNNQWYGWGADKTPAVWLNTGYPEYGVPSGWLALHPGNGFQPSVLRWTAPEGGIIKITGEFLPGHSGSMDIAVRQNNDFLWTGKDSGQFYIFPCVNKGDVIDFLVYGGYGAGNTPLNATITFYIPTYTLLASSPQPSIYGEEVTFNALVITVPPETGVPIGTVTFFDDFEVLGTVELVNSMAEFSTNSLSIGDHIIEAVYNGEANFEMSSSGSIIQTVYPDTLFITNSGLPDGDVKSTYNQSLKVVNGTGPYTWSITQGNLPPGLTLKTSKKESSIATISGKLTEIDNYTFTIQVKDNTLQTYEKDFKVTVYPRISLLTTSLPEGIVGKEYAEQLQAEGGDGNYTWALAGGMLPPGLSLNSWTGLISGMPDASIITKAKTYKVSFNLSDGSGGKVKSKNLSLRLTLPLTIVTASSLPEGDIGIKYSQTMKATGGSGKYNWSLADGSVLPEGLSFSKKGIISGKASKDGNYGYTVIVDDGKQNVQKEFSLTINENLEILTLSLPNGKVGQAYLDGENPVALTAKGGDGNYTWTITGKLPTGLKLDKVSGIISGTPSKAGVFNFTVKVKDGLKAATTVKQTITVE
jgi:hypothetical protein